MFYPVTTARVIFKAKTSLDVFSLRRERVLTGSVLSDCICEMKRVIKSGQQGIKTRDHFSCTLTLGEPSPNRESNPKDNWVPPIAAFYNQQVVLRAYSTQ